MSAGRVLCIASSLPRWQGDTASPFVLRLAQDLQALGWQVDLLAPHAPGTASREILDGVQVERFRYQWPASQETICYQGGALVNLRKRPLNTLKLPILVAAEWAAVTRRLATRRYDVLHSHWILPQGFIGMLSRWIGNIPHVTTVHGGDIFGLQGALSQRLKREVLHHADAVTVNSSFTEAAVHELAPNTKRLARIPMGVDVEPPDSNTQQRAAAIRKRYHQGAGPLLVFIGRVIDEKGPEDLIRAVDLLRYQLPDVTAVIIGDGPDRHELEQLAMSLGIEDRITFSGWIEPSEIQTWLVAGDCFIGPSRRASNGWVEAQGLTFLEAMIAATPVIATRIGGIPDAVIHNRTGLLIDERSPKQIANAVSQLNNNPRQAKYLTTNAQKHAALHFSRAASAQKFDSLFQQLCPPPQSG